MKFIGIPRAEKDKGEKIRSVIGGILLFSFVFICVLGAESLLSKPKSTVILEEDYGQTMPATEATVSLMPANANESLPQLANRSSDFSLAIEGGNSTIPASPSPKAGVSPTAAPTGTPTPAESSDPSDTTGGDKKSSEPSDKQEPPETTVPITESAESVHYYVIAELSIRKGPGTEYDKIGSLQPGDEIDSIAATSNGWKKLAAEKYVIGDYLSQLPPETSLEATFYAIGDVNVRSGPGTQYDILKTLKAGDEISVVAETSNGWYRTVKNTYVNKEVCASTPPVSPTPAPTPTPVPKPTTPPAPTEPTNPSPSPVSVGQTVACTITFYGPQKQADGSFSDRTATGTTCEVGRTVAADWSIFPANSNIYIEGLPLNLYDGSFSDDGYYVVEDKGSAVKGYMIDIFVPSEEIADALGNQRTFMVTLVSVG